LSSVISPYTVKYNINHCDNWSNADVAVTLPWIRVLELGSVMPCILHARQKPCLVLKGRRQMGIQAGRWAGRYIGRQRETDTHTDGW
jgi:hypothetical protein